MPSSSACLVTIVDPENTSRPDFALLRETLHVTFAEAQLTVELLKGASLREAAQTLDVAVDTCKSQLKSIYSKTGCKSRADLVRLAILTTAGRVATPS